MTKQELEFILDFAKNIEDETIDNDIAEDASEVGNITLKYLVKTTYEGT